MNTFERINRTVDERRKQQPEPDKLLNRVYRENDKASSQFCDDAHQTPVDPDNPFSGTVQESYRTRETEWAGLQLAGGKVERPEAPPLYTVPDRYKEKRPCTCKNHVGKKWLPLAAFSERKGKNGKLYPSSWCKECVARHARERYQEAKSLSRFP